MLNDNELETQNACVAFDWHPEDMGKQYDNIPPQLYEAMMDSVKYRELEEICEEIKTLNLPKDIAIVDIGAGTGRAGRFLKSEGFKNIEAIDASQRFLESLEATGAYSKKHHLYLGMGNYPFEEHKEHFDLVVSAGVWLTGHIPWKGMSEVVDCMKPGAKWVLAMRTKFYTPGEPERYREGLDELVEQKRIKLVATRTFMRGSEDCEVDLWKPQESTLLVFEKI